MPFNISEFRSQLTYGGARPTLFQVQVPGSRKIQFMCKSAQIPGATFGMIDVPYFGRKFKIKGDRTYNEWSTTIINDEDFAVRDFLEDWMAKMNDPVSNLSAYRAVSDHEQRTLSVTQFGKNGQALKTYYLIYAWPSDISPIELSWETTDQIEEFTVNWVYSYWTTDKNYANERSTISDYRMT